METIASFLQLRNQFLKIGTGDRAIHFFPWIALVLE